MTEHKKPREFWIDYVSHIGQEHVFDLQEEKPDWEADGEFIKVREVLEGEPDWKKLYFAEPAWKYLATELAEAFEKLDDEAFCGEDDCQKCGPAKEALAKFREATKAKGGTCGEKEKS